MTSIARQNLKPVQSVLCHNILLQFAEQRVNKSRRKTHGKKVDGETFNCVEDDEYAFTVGFGKSCDRSGSETVDLQIGGVVLNGVLID